MDKLGLNFGVLIAYLIPGFLGTYALAEHVSAINALLGGAERVPGTGSYLPLLYIALAVGIVINAFSSIVIRTLIHWSGIDPQPGIVQKRFPNEDLPRYEFVVESTFRYHQFYTNMLVAILLLTRLWLSAPYPEKWLRIASFLLVISVLFSAARSSLRSFYIAMSGFTDKAK